MRRSLVIVAAIALTWSPWSANAYPNRAGDCPEGTKAVGGDHLTSSAVHGSLPDGSLEISIDGDVLSRSTPYVVETGVDHTITLSGSNEFIGFLIRLGSGSSDIDTTSALSSSSSDAQIADVCVSDYGVGGICHNNPTSLGEISGTLRLDEESEDMLLDITVVTSFDPSEFYHSTYTVHSRAASPSAPVAPSAPSAPVTTAPATTAPVAPSAPVAPTAPSAPVTTAPATTAPAAPTTPSVTPAPVVPPTATSTPVTPVAPPTAPTGGSSAPVKAPAPSDPPVATSSPTAISTKFNADTSAPSVVPLESDAPSIVPSAIPTTVAVPTVLAVPPTTPTAPTPGAAAIGGLQSSTNRQCSSNSVGLLLLSAVMTMMWML